MLFGLAKKCLFGKVIRARTLLAPQGSQAARNFLQIRESSGKEKSNLGHKFLKQDLIHKKIRWGRVCITAPRRSEYKCSPPVPLIGHWSGHPDCRSNPCTNIYPLFDSMYYKPSDKDKRKYQQTWYECPNLVIEERPVCCYERYESLPFKKRSIEEIRKLTNFKVGTKPNCLKKKEVCPKITMPGCKPCRENPSCIVPSIPSDCEKTRCPYPSFSECVRPRKKRGLYRECTCWKFDGMCEVWAELRKQNLMKR